MTARLWRVVLSGDERNFLEEVVNSEQGAPRRIRRARILLDLDEGRDEGRLTQREVAERSGVSVTTVVRVAKDYAQRDGARAAISRKVRLKPPVESKVTAEVEARVIALACSQPPEGYGRWSLRLLERRIASTDGIPNLDHSTIGRILKKGHFSLA